MKLKGKNPITGQTVDVLDPKSYVQGIAGIGYLLLLAAGGLYAYRWVTRLTSGTPLGPITALPVRSGVPTKLRVVHGL